MKSLYLKKKFNIKRILSLKNLNILLILILLLLLFCVLYKINKKKEKFTLFDDIEVCDKVYNDTNYNKSVKKLPKIVPENMCDEILKEGIEYAKDMKWTLKRHGDYPTTDNEFTPDWKNYEYVYNIVDSIIFDNISKLFNIEKEKLKILELFLVKYENNIKKKSQHKLKKHKDGNEFSFIIALNDVSEYTGGGTYFHTVKKHVKLNKGDCVIFSGQQEHEGIKITSGKRFILTGFISYIDDGYCESVLNLN